MGTGNSRTPVGTEHLWALGTSEHQWPMVGIGHQWTLSTGRYLPVTGTTRPPPSSGKWALPGTVCHWVLRIPIRTGHHWTVDTTGQWTALGSRHTTGHYQTVGSIRHHTSLLGTRYCTVHHWTSPGTTRHLYEALLPGTKPGHSIGRHNIDK